MKIFVFLFFTALIFKNHIIFSQNINTDSVSHINYVELHDTYLNDIWGHVDQLGNEYAIVGCRKGTSIVSLAEPQNPIEIYWKPGTESVWRDVNTYQNYAYVTTEAEDGLLIIDMNSLPNVNGITTYNYSGPVQNPWQSAHTLFVDSAGYAYIFGSNRGNGGVIILDIHTNPTQPIEIGSFDNWYAHDGFVRGDTLYLAHIYDGFISIIDISDRSNPILLGTKNTPNNFSHNIWTDYSSQIAFTTDEVSGAYVASYDISNPQEITLLDQVQSSPGAGIIPHNAQYFNKYIVCSYYADGVVIFDVSNPKNMLQVGNFDTYPGQSVHFDGCWSSYPFLPSGLIIAADITQGMFVFQPNYQRAARFEGYVFNQDNNQALQDVKISIENVSHIEMSKNDGYFGTGALNNGSYNITFQKVGFYPKTINVNLIQGQAIIQNVYLIPIIPFSLTVKVKDSETLNEIIDAHVSLISLLTENINSTNGLGEINFSLFYAEKYKIIAGKWSYQTLCDSVNIDANTGVIEIFLKKGYEDDFTFDLGWTTVNNGATSGLWTREKPNPTSSLSAPDNDDTNDCGEKAYVTGNAMNLNSDFDDVDNGEVILVSPTFDLTSYENPFIHYSRWFYNYWGPYEVDDSLKIYLTNGFQTIMIDSQNSDTNSFYHWTSKAIKVKDFIFPTENMNLIIKTSDFNPNVNITEAGFDNFFIDSISHLSIKDNLSFTNKKTIIYPNPFNNEIYFLNPISKNWELYNGLNQIVASGVLDSNQKILFNDLNIGIYFVKNGDKIFKIFKTE